MHSDLCGPVTPATPRGRCFFLLLINDMSRYMWAVLLDTKAVAAYQCLLHPRAEELHHQLGTAG
jgi:hypothetical protein